MCYGGTVVDLRRPEADQQAALPREKTADIVRYNLTLGLDLDLFNPILKREVVVLAGVEKRQIVLRKSTCNFYS